MNYKVPTNLVASCEAVFDDDFLQSAKAKFPLFVHHRTDMKRTHNSHVHMHILNGIIYVLYIYTHRCARAFKTHVRNLTRKILLGNVFGELGGDC